MQRFRKDHSAELQEYQECKKQILQRYPSGHISTVEALKQKRNALTQERSAKNDAYAAAKQKYEDLSRAQWDIEEFLRQEQSKDQKKKRNDLE